eukprot:CAMPEP_0174888772 /NCGR_PEP_ID=MMETSP0167-20121228/4047_1 /TAXON_ID=38298 /ORGANISM="Rhodella maculata, Strain CCMP736" /LENGTH=38 /DNA_ID= /DNA_START= /DNA_END= /DNA_ORIENTATION=
MGAALENGVNMINAKRRKETGDDSAYIDLPEPVANVAP